MPPSAAHPQTPAAPRQQVPQRDVAVLDGVLERVTFSNPETGYTIARIAPDRGTGRGPVSAGTELLAEVAGVLEGTSEGKLNEPLKRQAAMLCRNAGTDPEAIPGLIEEGRRRAAAARQPPFSGGLHGGGAPP